MGAHGDSTIELIALEVRPHAVRCVEIGKGPVTYRRATEDVVPGQRLSVHVEKRWRFRKTQMVGGPLLHVGFSLRALQAAGFALPRREAVGIVSPGDGDARLREALLALSDGTWKIAHCLLVDVLQDHPACLPAHAAMGGILARLEHREAAQAHLTAAVRLGLAASSGDQRNIPLDPTRETERALLGALVARARLMAARDRIVDAVGDLQRALQWDPTDVAGAAEELANLEAFSDAAAVSR